MAAAAPRADRGQRARLRYVRPVRREREHALRAAVATRISPPRSATAVNTHTYTHFVFVCFNATR